MARGRGLGLLAAAALVAVYVGAAVPASATATFAVRWTGFAGGEPTLGVLPSGAILYQANTNALRTLDEGLTWTQVHQPQTGTLTLDPYIHVDAVTGRIWSSQLFGACQLISISSDGGNTWLQDPTQCGTGDHQKIGSGPWRIPLAHPLYPRAVYTCVNHVAQTACAVSQDGGLTWGPLQHVMPGVDPTMPETSVFGTGLCSGLLGDPTSGPDGTIYVPREYCGRPFLAVSEDDGLTWRYGWVAQPAQTRPIAFGANNPSVTAAADGTVFYAYTGDDWRHHVASSTDKGRTWSTPQAVSPPEVQSSTFPAIVAGRAGAVATAYIGTSAPGGPDETSDAAVWDLYVTYSTDANAVSPAWTTVKVTGGPDNPVMRGCIGRHGAVCSKGSLLDFNDIALTPDGRVAISYADACNSCSTAAQSTRQDGSFAIQTGGPTFG